MISSGGRSKLELRRSWIILHLQLERLHEFNPRLVLPFVYVSRFHISGHWDPDALARWYTMIPTCRLVHKGEPPAQKLLLDHRTGAGNSGGKARSRLKEWITSVLDYYEVHPPCAEATAVVKLGLV